MVVILEIPQELAQAVVNYLDTKPHREVAGFIQALLRLQPVKALEPPPEPPKG